MFHRKPSFAGSFYPDDKDLLYYQIDRFVKNGSIQKCDDIVAVVSPHAGYVYSGPVQDIPIRRLKAKALTAHSFLPHLTGRGLTGFCD